MASIVNIQLGNGDNVVEMKTTPTFRLEMKAKIKMFYNKHCIEWNVFYYVNGEKNPLIKIYYGQTGLRERNLEPYYRLKKFIQNMESNVSCEDNAIKWYNNTKRWVHIIPNTFKTKLCITLCNDAKQQFIQEMKGILHVARGIYIKQIGIHPAITARKLLAEM